MNAKKTQQVAAPEFGPSLPVYEGPPVAIGGCVTLGDGTACYVFDDGNENDPLPVLCRELVAMDAGSNVIRRRTAPAKYSGISAPVPGNNSLTVVPADGSIVGYYRAVQ